MNDPLPPGTNYVLQSTTATVSPIVVSATDDFETKTYNGGTGWASDWIEVNDDGDPAKKDVTIKEDQSSQRLHIKKKNNGIQRDVDLFQCSSATVSFDYLRKNFDPTDSITVAVVGGSTITTFGPVEDLTYQNGTFTDSGRFSQCCDDHPVLQHRFQR